MIRFKHEGKFNSLLIQGKPNANTKIGIRIRELVRNERFVHDAVEEQAQCYLLVNNVVGR